MARPLLPARLAAAPVGGLSGRPRPTRRPYRTSDYRFLAEHYPHHSARVCAAALGRTVGSVRQFIQARPELRKQGRT